MALTHSISAQQPAWSLDRAWPALLIGNLIAAAGSMLLAYRQPPIATVLNQCLALGMWGLVAAMLAPSLKPVRGTRALLAAMVVVALAAAGSSLWGTLPRSLSRSAIGLLAAAALLVLAGAGAMRNGRGVAAFTALAWAMLLAGLLSSIVAFLQVFAPSLTDDIVIASTTLPGRAVGNMRQPNHLCSLLLWAMASAVALHTLRRLPGWALVVSLGLLVLGVELSASRTGAVGLLLLLLWGAFDRRLPPGARLALVAAPLVYGLVLAGMYWWNGISHQSLGAAARLASESGLPIESNPNARTNVWRNALQLVIANPWMGTGFGEFNLAWSMTAFANRPTAYFDHAHNLPLQLMVELGLPLALLVLGLLGHALHQAWRRALAAEDFAQATAGRTALVMVLLIGVHSMVEYPLWIAYFLLPAALAWGLVLGLPSAGKDEAVGSGSETQARPSPAGVAAGLVMAAGGVFAAVDYQPVTAIYTPSKSIGPLALRIAQGQLGTLFAHTADYAAATHRVPDALRAIGTSRAIHALLDAQLMMAWSQQLARAGHVEEARWVAQRLRDFQKPDAAAFFAVCDQAVPAGASPPIQCQQPLAVHDWRELVKLRLQPIADPPASPTTR